MRVRVPASTSNLGPGFDLLGLAVGMYLEVEVLGRVEGGHRLETLGGTAREWPRGGDNVLLRAFDACVIHLGGEPMTLAWKAHSEIPIGRGLGSSGAATAAGILLGAASLGLEAAQCAGLLALGCRIEGHPDNSTAALLGGLTLALPHDDELTVVRHPVHSSIGLALAWGRTGLTTAQAREVLPAEVPWVDAIENPRRLALLLEGLRTGDPRLLALGGEERLHVRHRLPLIPGGALALEAARGAGAWLATVSGAGSALVALGPKEAMEGVAGAMGAALERVDGPATALAVDPVLDPPVPRPC